MLKTPPRPNVYLAGPEVFLRNAVEAGRIKAEICSRHGLEGCYPLIANLTPFRGAGADTGTVYEVGFARGLGKPVFGYSNRELSFFDRVAEFNVQPLKERVGAPPTMRFEDVDSMGVEQFGLAENLMVVSAMHDSGGSVVQTRTEQSARYTDLAAFEECVKQAARILLGT
jgi:nucleoside 2-deoxyribosyltransferase